MITSKYIEDNGIKIFRNDMKLGHADYNAQGLDNLYLAEEKHFWFLSRKEFIYQQLNSLHLNHSKIIEIGAGTGNVSRYLMSNGFSNIAVGEMHFNGLKYAQSYGIKECYQFDLLDSPFQNEFETVCMFDVLEHISDAPKALKNVHNMLYNKGYVVLTVPAHRWLWNRDDAIAGHKKRYTKVEIITELESHGFELVTARYFFMCIIPLLLLRTYVNKDDSSPVSEEEYSKEITINPVINLILTFLCKAENKLSKYLPNWFGGSLLVIGRKQ